MLKRLTSLTWGTDPEAFFVRNGNIIGSEKIIPEKGLFSGVSNKIVRDGVQFEFNPNTSATVYGLGRNLCEMFQHLRRAIKEAGDVDICFDGLVEVSKEELDSLSPGSRVLGCMPSYHFYGAKPITVDPLTYRKRSSGGHIHIGLALPIYNRYAMHENDSRARLVPLLDLFVGNTCVLLDRDPGSKERRENYGRAGEYRLPYHGLEYRTPSNFWLRDYSLMSFVFGMAAVAASILHETLTGNDLESKLVELIDITKVQAAIDTNDYDLALENFITIQPFLQATLPLMGFPLTPRNLNQFLSFSENVKNNGIEKYFPANRIIDNWCSYKQDEFSEFVGRV